MTDSGVARNVVAYRKRAHLYEDLHGEIFNTREQARLKEALHGAMGAMRSGGLCALDFGCGSGNLTRHMLSMGLSVTCADVSPEFLRLVAQRYGVVTIELSGGATSTIPDGTFDFIGLYSVLHHIPAYLAAVRDLVPKLRHGGVIFIDHERNEHWWNPPPELRGFHRENAGSVNGRRWDPDHKRWQHLLRAGFMPSRHLARYRRLRRISVEGDIHVYADDHIDWSAVIATLQEGGADIVKRADYLQFTPGYDDAVWERWRRRCDDMTSLTARRA